MTPLEFLSFRTRLEAASGFQSYQFRELEYVLGAKNEKAIQRFPEGSDGRVNLQRRYEARTLWDAFLTFLAGQGFPIPEVHLKRDVTQSVEAAEDLQEILVEVYREHPAAASVCERLVDLDEGLQEWRYRHVKMVERTIGMKAGSGGSAGSAYLRTTLNAPVFPDLWAIRSQL
jgi:tryptophan 2,3-dioxygenase